ncbi:MAG: translation initiation factor IF-2, partial [Eubacterium sp.]|nr:translation initiation factor IF-2 [Eubacterium sp.]
MAKMRIYEIARSMQQQNKQIKGSDIVAYLNANGYEVKSVQSSIEGDAIPFLMVSYQKGLIPFEGHEVEGAAAKEVKKEVKKPAAKKTEEKTVKKEEPKKEPEITETESTPKKTEKKQEKKQESGEKPVKSSTVKGTSLSGTGKQTRAYHSDGGADLRAGSDSRRGGRGDGKQGYDNRDKGGRGDKGGRTGRDNNRFANSAPAPSFDGGGKPDSRRGGRGKKQKNDYNRTGGGYHKASEDEMRRARSKKDPNRAGAFIRPKQVEQKPEDDIRSIKIPEVLTIRELAERMKMPASGLVKKLFLQGRMVTQNQDISYEEAEEIALEYDILVELEEKVDVVAELLKEDEEDESKMQKRPPVVCVMGHVDHGKTSLLDAIRETDVSEHEAGGITQHIGAYMVRINGQKITFLDTPGHEAFTSMRMRGAQSTDIAVLVVAADDGVMPQTIEAINHAKAAGVEIIVAVNKIDKEGANIERVKKELAEYELVPEEWGGQTVFCPVSAHTKEGIENLLEMIVLTADVLELKANPKRDARGVVIEAELDKGRGPVATVLVQKGTLNVGDHIAVGPAYGKVRAMIDHKGERVKSAKPSTPVEILGLNGVPDAGEIFVVKENDRDAKQIAQAYIAQSKDKLIEDTKAKKLSLDGLFDQIQAGNIKELGIIIKADVQGSVEAVKQSLVKLSNDEVAVRVIHGGVGMINESDVSLASASNAIIIGFNVRMDNQAKETAERENVDVRTYSVIYNAIEDVESAMKGMLEPIYEEKVIAHAEIRQLFKASGVGTIAGSYVLDGTIERGCSVRISREGEQIFEGALASLKRFKDDVKEVNAG